MSNFQTLLDAAKFVECTNTPDFGARAPDPPEFHHYAKPAISRKRSNSGSDKSDRDEDLRDRKRYGGSGTREVHNILEKNRRAHLKECFDGLKQEIPNLENHNKVSNLSILRGAYRYILLLKKREKDLEQEFHELSIVKIKAQQRIIALRGELNDMNISVDISNFMPPLDEDTRSVSTATAHNEGPIMSDDEENEYSDSVRFDQINDVPVNKPALNFCNVIVTSANPVYPALKPELTEERLSSNTAAPLLTLRGITYSKASNTQPSAASNNRTIAAMLSNSIQTSLNSNAGLLNANVLSAIASSRSQQHQTLPACSTSTVTVNNNSFARINIDNKASVNQLLQQTIAQRAQLQQLATLNQRQSAPMVVTSTGNLTSAINVGQLTANPHVITMNANALRPMLSNLKAIPQLQSAVALNHFLPSTFTLNVGKTVATTTTTTMSLTNSLPITMAMLNKSPGVVMSSTSLASTTMPQSAMTIINQLGQLNSSENTHLSLPLNLTGLQALTLAGMKPIITLPIAHLNAQALEAQQVTNLQQLISQTVSRAQSSGSSTANQISSSINNTITLPTKQLVSGATITSIPVCQLLPLNIVSAANQATPLSQVNMTNVTLNTELLKSLSQLPPLLQQQIGLPVKPIVMVTLANTPQTSIAKTSTPTIRVNHVNIPVSQS